MLNTPGIHLYGHLSAYINYKYCSQHGYTFIVERCPQKEDIKKDWMWDETNQFLIVWSKPALVRRHLPNYDYLLILDSDALFLDHDKKIENLIEKYMNKIHQTDVCILAGQDCMHSTWCWSKTQLNAGVIFFKNNPQTLTILDHWINSTKDECKKWKYEHSREQMCLQVLKEKHYKKNIKIIPYYEINGVDGHWIRHYMAVTSDERFKLMNQHFQHFFGQECRNSYSSCPPKMIIKEDYFMENKQKLVSNNLLLCFNVSCFIMGLFFLSIIGLRTKWCGKKS